jgi:hypothetical protein
MEAVSEVEAWQSDPPPNGSLVRQPPGTGIDRHRGRGLDLTPEEHRARRVNRRWLLGLAVPSVAILVLALVASGVAEHNQPSGPNIPVPAGFQAVRDGYFTYAVPRSWPNSPVYSDNAGDLVNAGTTGWAGQHIGFLKSPPALGATPPAPLSAFEVPGPEQFQLTGGHAVTVKGAQVAWRYIAIRAGGFQATVVDAYDAKAAVEIWLMVAADPTLTDQIVSSLAA